MGVLIEGISVVVRREAIERKLVGGFEQFQRLIPNATACSDAHFTRVGFMAGPDVKDFVESLVARDLTFHDGHQFVDIAVVDQHHGPTAPTPWLSILQVSEGFKFAFLTGQDPGDLVTPTAWSPEMSLLRTGSFVDNADVDALVQPLEKKDGLEVVFDRRLNKTMFIGRTTEAESTDLDAPPSAATARAFLLQFLRDHAREYPSLDSIRMAIQRHELDVHTLPSGVRWGLHYAGLINLN